MKHGLPGDIEDIDDNREIKAHVISQVKSELSRGYSILLIVFVVLYKVF
jgi:hypothetical protein